MNKTEALLLAKEKLGGLSATEKMPCYSWSISAKRCKTGNKLKKDCNSVCAGCTASKNRYKWSTIQRPLEKRFEIWKQSDSIDWVKTFATVLNELAKYSAKNRDAKVFRWFDSGDLQSVDMLAQICKIAELTPSVKHWLPTKEIKFVTEYINNGGEIPDNLLPGLRISAYYKDKPAENVYYHGKKLNTAEVTTNPDKTTCPAYNTKPANCGKCRACWTVPKTVYAYK